MVLYPAALAFILIWLILTVRDPDNGLTMSIAVIPFGMFAGIVASGLSIILAHLLAILTIGILILRSASLQKKRTTTHLPKPAIYLCLFAAYSLFSGLILVRIFEGDFLVFPMNVTPKGNLTSSFFTSTMVPLRPSNSNISQSFYVILSTAFFVTAILVARRRGIKFLEGGIIWAAVINVILGVLDLMQLDAVLQFVRTADYNLNNQHAVNGVSRIIGGYSEAAGFGAVSAAFFAYFSMSFLINGRTGHAVLALMNLTCATLAFSSTAILAVVAAVILIVLHGPAFVNTALSRNFAHVLVIAIAVAVVAICLTLLLTPAETFVSGMLDSLIFSKGNSMSGLERAAWANNGFDVFVQTWGFGAGAGSLRASGLTSVLLGNVGWPGGLAFGMFVLHAILIPLPRCERQVAGAFYSGRLAALTLLVSMLVSATGPNPTLLLVVFASVSVVAREAASSRRSPINRQKKYSIQVHNRFT